MPDLKTNVKPKFSPLKNLPKKALKLYQYLKCNIFEKHRTVSGYRSIIEVPAWHFYTSQRKLAKYLGLSRKEIRGAISILESTGLIETITSHGCKTMFRIHSENYIYKKGPLSHTPNKPIPEKKLASKRAHFHTSTSYIRKKRKKTTPEQQSCAVFPGKYKTQNYMTLTKLCVKHAELKQTAKNPGSNGRRIKNALKYGRGMAYKISKDSVSLEFEIEQIKLLNDELAREIEINQIFNEQKRKQEEITVEQKDYLEALTEIPGLKHDLYRDFDDYLGDNQYIPDHIKDKWASDWVANNPFYQEEDFTNLEKEVQSECFAF